METVSKMKYSRTDRLVLGIGYAILGLFVLSIVVPLVYVVLASFMDPTVLNNQGLSFHIKDWTLDAYRRVLENGMIWRIFKFVFVFTVICGNFRICHIVSSVSDVEKRICRKKIF